MDPITQGALGSAATLALLGRRVPFSLARLAWIGATGGMAADLDTLIRSSADPLLYIEFHRHFSHSLAFIPIGGPLAALPWLLAKSLRPHWRWLLAASTIGYATHGLLDAFTTYGTLLLWPFSHLRVSWRWISVIDLAFTLPLLAGVAVAVRRAAPKWAGIGLLAAGSYLCLGGFQHLRADSAQRAIAQERGHPIQRGQVFPMFMNNVAWRSVYESRGRYYVDKIRVTLTGKTCVTPGTTVPVLRESASSGPSASAESAAPHDDPDMHPAAARAHRLIRWFAAGWVALDPEDPDVIGDLRYSFSPTEAVPIWGVRIDDESGQVEWVNNRSRRAVTLDDWLTLVGEDGDSHRCF